MPLEFEWDASKAVVNLKKHGVGFDEACTVFDDPLAAIFRDDDHSTAEVREIVYRQFDSRPIGPCFVLWTVMKT
jgi:uncharacterized DUF497 family protein